jgi:hypothetical protein
VAHLFLVGGVVSGRNDVPIFIENGRLHAERAIACIAERLQRR